MPLDLGIAASSWGETWAPVVWDPTSLPGIEQWFDMRDPATVTLSGDSLRVVEWRNKLGTLSNLDLVAVTAGTEPFLDTLNGQPGIRTDGTDARTMKSRVIASTTYPALPFYYFFAVKPNKTAGVSERCWFGSYQSYREFYFTGANYRGYWSNYRDSGIPSTESPHVMCWAFTAANTILYVDSLIGASMAATTARFKELRIGRSADAGYAGSSIIGEFFTSHGTTLTQGDRETAMTYLRTGWGI